MVTKNKGASGVFCLFIYFLSPTLTGGISVYFITILSDQITAVPNWVHFDTDHLTSLDKSSN